MDNEKIPQCRSRSLLLTGLVGTFEGLIDGYDVGDVDGCIIKIRGHGRDVLGYAKDTIMHKNN